jgi:hypothetical protein
MTPPRPKSVSAVCSLAIIAALVELFTSQMAYWVPDDPILIAWRNANPTAAAIELFVACGFAAIALFMCYFMLRAKNWARWIYLIISAIHYTFAFALLAFSNLGESLAVLRFRAAFIPGLLFFIIALIVLFLPRAREYFQGGGRPYWRIEQEQEEREERRKNRS